MSALAVCTGDGGCTTGAGAPDPVAFLNTSKARLVVLNAFPERSFIVTSKTYRPGIGAMISDRVPCD